MIAESPAFMRGEYVKKIKKRQEVLIPTVFIWVATAIFKAVYLDFQKIFAFDKK